MQISALSILVIFIAITLPAPLFAAKGECGFVVQIPAGKALQRDHSVQKPLCLYVEKSEQPTPFVNSVVAISWEGWNSLKVSGQPLSDIGFFRWSRTRLTYSGRPSYTDDKNGYQQQVKDTQVIENSKNARGKKLVIKNELNVKWLRMVSPTVQEEVSEVFVCTDAAAFNSRRVAILNWCLPKNKANDAALLKMERSFKLD